MSDAKVSLIPNPMYIPDDEQLAVKNFRVEMFKLIPGDDNGDRIRYEKFMLNVFPMNPESKIEITESSKTWTKEGALVICLECVEMHADEKAEDPDKREY